MKTYPEENLLINCYTGFPLNNFKINSDIYLEIIQTDSIPK